MKNILTMLIVISIFLSSMAFPALSSRVSPRKSGEAIAYLPGSL